MPKDRGSTLKLQWVQAMLTYPGFHDPVELRSFLHSKLALWEPEFNIWQEYGDTGHEHTHAVVRCAKKVNTTRHPRDLDFRGAHPHIKPPETKLHARNQCKYQFGKGKDHTDLPALHEISEDAALTKKQRRDKAKTYAEFINSLLDDPHYERQVSPADAWAARPQPPGRTLETLYPWQEKIYEMLKQPADDRKIIWVYETVGNVGKTRFGQHVCATLGGVYLSGITAQADGAYILAQADQPRVVVVDLARAHQSTFPWGLIEGVKNGSFSSSKYRSTTVMYTEPVHVLCLANFPPPLCDFSLDRLATYEVNNRTKDFQ